MTLKEHSELYRKVTQAHEHRLASKPHCVCAFCTMTDQEFLEWVRAEKAKALGESPKATE